MRTFVIDIVYLACAVLFIFGLKMLSSPKTARAGNIASSIGMLMAIVSTLFAAGVVDYRLIMIGIPVGAAIGAVMAVTVKMTAMPQMVGILNGFGGLASVLIATSQYFLGQPHQFAFFIFIPILLSVTIGGITFTGSLIAYGKLQGIVSSQPIVYRTKHHVAQGTIHCDAHNSS